MKFRRFLAWLLISGCIAVVFLFVAALILASISLQNDPWLASDIRIWQAAHDDLVALPDFEFVSIQDDGSFLLHNVGVPDQSATLPAAIAANDSEMDIRVVLPLYGHVSSAWREKMTKQAEFTVRLSWRQQYCAVYSLIKDGVTYYFIDKEY